MLTLILVVAFVVVVSGLVATRRRSPAAQLAAHKSAAALLERTIRDLRPRDIVQHDGKDFLVEGVVTYEEDGHKWSAARMHDAGNEHWLLVGLERTGDTTVRLLTPAAGLEVHGFPADALEFGGATYKQTQRGTATVSVAGDLGGRFGDGAKDGTSSRCRWWRYQADAKTLFLEQWGETYRGLVGETVPLDSVDFLPAT